jgi:hypothetical protein
MRAEAIQRGDIEVMPFPVAQVLARQPEGGRSDPAAW